MTKTEFFAILDNHLKMKNGSFNAFGEYVESENPAYTPADVAPYEFHEKAENLEKWRKEDPRFPWIAHSSGYVLANCWYISLISHKTAEAATKQTKIFARWIAEYKTK